MKYLKNTETNIYNVLIITDDFNIRDNIWDLSHSSRSFHSNSLIDIADSIDLMLSKPTNQVPTRYLDNIEDIDSVIDLMFLKPNSLEINNYTIYPEWKYSLDHALLIVVSLLIKNMFLPKDKLLSRIAKKKIAL